MALKLLTGYHSHGRQAQRHLYRNNDVVCVMMGKCVHVPFVVLACLLTVTPALAHDSWISRGGFRGPKNGEWCCGASDCFVVSSQSVRVNGVGYELAPTQETVPYEESIPSADGQYWRCQRPDGTRRCFFAPMLGF